MPGDDWNKLLQRNLKGGLGSDRREVVKAPLKEITRRLRSNQSLASAASRSESPPRPGDRLRASCSASSDASEGEDSAPQLT